MKRQEEGAQNPEGRDEFTRQRSGEWHLTQKDSRESKEDASEVEGWEKGARRDTLAGN